ncbi:MAG TPA: hypothetical protein VNF73_17920, partial [Candidatus Saccharimonadales bacterium]|nr:hypothetical protein [Candidatus Saccharimonadales bacterium]
MSDERRDPIDLHALAEDVASDRLTMSAAEARIRGAIGDAEAGRRAIDELRSLTRALGAVRTHASAWREEQKDARADRRAAADRDVTAYRRAAESHSAPSHGPGVVAPAPVGGGAAPGRGYRRGRGRGRGR